MRILVAGDAMVDRYWFGDVRRISPEAPVPVFAHSHEEERPGAAANVARNCQAMGAEVVNCFSRSPERVVKIRLIARAQQMTRVDFDHPQSPITLENFTACLTPAPVVVVLSDYGKGAFTKSNLPLMVSAAKEAGAKVLVDPKGYDYRKYRGADVVKPNLEEMKELVGGWGSEVELETKVRQLRVDAGLGAILLTRAAEGMTLYDGIGTFSVASEAREVYDVSGAGDTAIAALAVALGRGMSLRQAVMVANRAAGIVVERFGTAIATKEEVFDAAR